MIRRFYSLQVDLFRDASIMSAAMRLQKQIETRNFKLCCPIAGIRDHLQQFPDNAVNVLVERLQSVERAGRSYEHIGKAGCDSLWELEALGIGEWCRTWTVMIDLSDALDLLMHLEFNCSVDECRAMQDYETVSKSLLNYKFDNGTTKFGVLFFESAVMSKAYMQIIKEIEENPTYACCTQDEKMSHFVFTVYSRILQKAADVKDYIVAALQAMFPGQIIYRSKNFSSAIMTSDVEINSDLVLKHDDLEYTIKVRSYKRYEWAQEVMANEFNREAFNW